MLIFLLKHFKSSRRDVSCKEVWSATLLKKRLWPRSFPVNFGKFLRTPLLTEHLRWLLSDIFRHDATKYSKIEIIVRTFFLLLLCRTENLIIQWASENVLIEICPVFNIYYSGIGTSYVVQIQKLVLLSGVCTKWSLF